ncbi:MAG: DUF951 domain-containing protein [Peptococcaceae bacterium]|nr:DUF951 domain-containing protein [Peptococcaceae bacterium]
MVVYPAGTVLTLKKPHPCGSHDWQVMRPGMEYRLKCRGCGHVLLMNRDVLMKAVKAVKEASGGQEQEGRQGR